MSEAASERTVLIVDDEQKVFAALRRTLHREQWSCIYANGHEEAEKILASQSVDVAIVDMNMPGMDGAQLLARIRQKWPDVARIMLTGDARLDVVMKAVNNGEIFRFFVKPANEAELVVAIRDALAMKSLKQESEKLLEALRSGKLVARKPPDADGDGVIDTVIKLPSSEAVPEKLGVPTPPAASVFKLDEGQATPGKGDDVASVLQQIRQELGKRGK